MSLALADLPLAACAKVHPPTPIDRTLKKRSREAAYDETRTRANRCVRFSHIDIRMHGVEIWGGGGVPADDGPPLGLSWHVEGEHRIELEEYETQRLSLRIPKETYCTMGCVEPQMRTQILLHHGNTHRQINSIKKEVAKLNRERWQASEILFNDSWLFSAVSCSECADILAVIGQTESEGFELSADSWSHPVELANALAAVLQVDASNLLSDDHIDWARLSGLLQELRRHVVFLIDCTSSEPLALQLVGRFVACVHTAHVAAQVSPNWWCRLSVVLRGYQLTHIVASWEEDETDEFFVASLD